ncbi:MAG TPA: hypothetical protein VES68_01120 [Candidatus Sulfotelmatobacter sp.]|nr:hypothetical protein [Candidatus Sulfotelmatobacter sp.]
MKKFLTDIKADKITSRGFIISFIVSLVTLTLIFIFYGSLPPVIPIFNQLPWGPQRLLPTIGIFIPMIIFGFLFLFNLVFSSVIYSKNPLIARFIVATTLLLSVINFLFIIRTIFLII